MVKVLLSRGAKVNRFSLDGRTALYIASVAGKADVVQLLLERGARVFVFHPSSTLNPLKDAANEDVRKILSARALVVELTRQGMPTVEGKTYTLDQLQVLLKARAHASGTESERADGRRREDYRTDPMREHAAKTAKSLEKGLPLLEVKIVAPRECRYRAVQDVMVQCMRAYIWRLSFGAKRENKTNGRLEKERDGERGTKPGESGAKTGGHPGKENARGR